jgi:RNA polymerase sigma-70 factor (ECF subfamily)
MADQDSLAVEFEAHRAHLRGVAYRVLGSLSDADDAVQETWLRLSRADVADVVSLRAWLTTVTGRIALNMLQARAARREDIGAEPPEPAAIGHAAAAGQPHGSPSADPEAEALLGDSVSVALQLVLDTLEPRERLAFVLHDLFAVPFDEVAPVTGTTSVAARQLASRARRRVRQAAEACTGGTASAPGAPRTASPLALALAARDERHREIVAAFYAAARDAQFAALLEMLDPDIAVRADAVAARMGAVESAFGAETVARWLSGKARGAVFAVVDGEPGAAWVVDGTVRVAFAFTIALDGRIAAIDLIAEPEILAGLDVTVTG